MTSNKQTPLNHPSAGTTADGERNQRFIWLVVFLFFFAFLSFRVVWSPQNVLFTTDDNMGALMLRKRALPDGFLRGWSDHTLVGIEDPINFNWTNLLLWLLPVRWFTNWIHAIDLFGASLFLALFLRRRGVGLAACALGALTAFWVGSNMTLTYAGHIGKFAILMFAALTLWLIERAVSLRRLCDWLLVGGGFACMFLEQADVALFFSLAIGPYLLFAIWREGLWTDRKTLTGLIGMAAVAGLMALRALWLGYQTGIQDVASVQQEDPQAKWEFLTQWSWPPEESIDFIAPGYMGWRSGEPAGPYWGRMGRSAGWETTRQGFQNFKLENQYLGFLPLAFAIVAIWLALARGTGYRRDTVFWGVVVVVALMLSFGKYFPLYRLFAMLPVVSSIRNPNKFLQVFQLALGILAAYGLRAVERKDEQDRGRFLQWPMWICAAALGLLLLMALSATSSIPREAARFAAEGWGAYADAIVKGRAIALWHAVLMAGLCLVVWSVYKRALSTRLQIATSCFVVAIVALDSLWLGRHYIQAMPREAFARNAVVEFFLKKTEPGRRIALATQQGFYNFWLTYTFPYEGLRAVNVTQMPRMPVDYEQFLKKIGGNVGRLWQLFAVQYVVMPSAMWNSVRNDAQWTQWLEPVYAFDAYPSPNGFYQFAEKPVGTGQHTVFQLKIPAPFMVPIGAWKQLDDLPAVLQSLADARHNPLTEILIAQKDADGMPTLSEPGPNGEVRFLEQGPGYWRVQVAPERASIVRFAQRYTRDWKAEVDRKPARLRRCDYLFQGVEVNPGLHEIVLRYAPPFWPLALQGVGMLVWLGAALGAILNRSRGNL